MANSELADAIDGMYAIDVEIKKHNTQIDVLKAHRKGLELKVMQELGNASLSAAGGQLASATLSMKTVYNADNGEAGWPLIYNHIRVTGEFDLMHKRLTISACDERWKAGATVPGIVQTKLPELKITGRG